MEGSKEQKERALANSGFHLWNFLSPVNVSFFQSIQVLHKELTVSKLKGHQQHLKK
jgi:hypothetical protein